MNKPSKTLQTLNRALVISEELDDELSIAKIHSLIGLLDLSKNKKDKALENCLKAFGIYKRLNNLRGISESSAIVGRIYFEMEQFTKAQQYLNKLIELETLTSSKKIGENSPLFDLQQ